MPDSGNLPSDIDRYSQVPHTSLGGGVLEELLEHQLQQNHAVLAEHGVELEGEFKAPVKEYENLPANTPDNGNHSYYEEALNRDVDGDIPESGFLLRSPSGDVYLFPNGISEEDTFVVLFFAEEKDLMFRPSEGTNFIGSYDAESERQTYDLFYSGILFKLPDSSQLAVIFHKR
jgi:hypothetical protein